MMVSPRNDECQSPVNNSTDVQQNNQINTNEINTTTDADGNPLDDMAQFALLLAGPIKGAEKVNFSQKSADSHHNNSPKANNSQQVPKSSDTDVDVKSESPKSTKKDANPKSPINACNINIEIGSPKQRKLLKAEKSFSPAYDEAEVTAANLANLEWYESLNAGAKEVKVKKEVRKKDVKAKKEPTVASKKKDIDNEAAAKTKKTAKPKKTTASKRASKSSTDNPSDISKAKATASNPKEPKQKEPKPPTAAAKKRARKKELEDAEAARKAKQPKLAAFFAKKPDVHKKKDEKNISKNTSANKEVKDLLDPDDEAISVTDSSD